MTKIHAIFIIIIDLWLSLCEKYFILSQPFRAVPCIMPDNAANETGHTGCVAALLFFVLKFGVNSGIGIGRYKHRFLGNFASCWSSGSMLVNHPDATLYAAAEVVG